MTYFVNLLLIAVLAVPGCLPNDGKNALEENSAFEDLSAEKKKEVLNALIEILTKSNDVDKVLADACQIKMRDFLQ
jgi:hypothetical protein